MSAVCKHGMMVGLPDITDPMECRLCDWCAACKSVQEWTTDEKCAGCGAQWGGES